jgi:hypothetical protein
MTEDQIERRVERMIDHLDRLLLSGSMTQKNYNLAMIDLSRWAESKYRENRR